MTLILYFDRGSGGKVDVFYGLINNTIGEIEQINSMEYSEELKYIVRKEYFPPRGDIESVLQAVKDVKPGDTIVTSALINFSMSFYYIVEIIALLVEKGIKVISIMEGFCTPDDINYSNDIDRQLIISFDTIKKFDKIYHKEFAARQRIGIEKAKKDGKYNHHGGSKSYQANDFVNFKKLYKEWAEKKITKNEFAINLGVSRPTLNKLLKNTNEND